MTNEGTQIRTFWIAFQTLTVWNASLKFDFKQWKVNIAVYSWRMNIYRRRMSIEEFYIIYIYIYIYIRVYSFVESRLLWYVRRQLHWTITSSLDHTTLCYLHGLTSFLPTRHTQQILARGLRGFLQRRFSICWINSATISNRRRSSHRYLHISFHRLYHFRSTM